MAIDSEDKRRSVHGYTMTPIYPVADGTIGTQDRPHVAWIYRGLVIQSVLAIVKNWTLKSRSLAISLWARDIGLELVERGTGWTIKEDDR